MSKSIFRMMVSFALLIYIPLAVAQSAREMRKQTEASMLVTGHVLVDEEGNVSGWEIDRPEKLPPVVVRLVERSAPIWKFEPVLVDGQPRKAKARMSLRLVANQQDDGDYQISIRSGYFGEEALRPSERMELAGTSEIQSIDLRPPFYPVRAAEVGAQGTVYVVLRINRQGHVDDVLAEQVNLKTVGNETQMRHMRDMLAKPALAAARKWTFQIPTTGESAGNEFWLVRVPVDFMLRDKVQPGYGQWDAYIPGPRHHAPWQDAGLDPNDSPDAMVAGGIYQVGKGLRLLTPLQQG